ncbi:hypothetical protein E4K67_16935 [Desulfosporosinus fructosivorans]|uniref:Peptidase M50 domain-containing protein n=1 Tax=Desulfosporosinus fructosivorans TaxID=2018669 RepID=A0A4Z0R471_9FIRM|nr:hypothetical protein [Desulfosporosinus fructosivorans]TGE36797.1 hypothetical protein E4K67_16935 [Desulfosporosinus fructosivorans]
MKENIKFAILFPCILLAGGLLYLVAHELGHTIVAIICGAEITQFSILNAHMSYNGGTFSKVMYSLFNAAGMLLPIILIVPIIISYKRNKKSILYHCCYITACLWGISPLLAWLIVPVVSLLDSPPQGDDVAKYIMSSEWHPMTVFACALAILIGLLVLVIKKGIIPEFIEIIKGFSYKNNC